MSGSIGMISAAPDAPYNCPSLSKELWKAMSSKASGVNRSTNGGCFTCTEQKSKRPDE